MRLRNSPTLLGTGAVACLAASIALCGCSGQPASGPAADHAAAPAPITVAAAAQAADSVALSEAQVGGLGIGPATLHAFAVQRSAVGSIDFNENRSVPVFAPYLGKIIEAFGDIGDEVVKGRTLFTVDSPDLVQAESTLIAAAGVYELSTVALARARELSAAQGLAQKELEQAVSDQQTAEAALKAARTALHLFGKADADIDALVAWRRIDPALVVRSPVSGRITARSAQPGLLVQPGSAPAPFTVSDLSSVWMVANVTEGDSPVFHPGQPVRVKVLALARIFEGRITAIGAAVDPNTHTVAVRSELRDPAHELRPGMLATFVIRTGAPLVAVAVPQNGVVREGDGTMSVWVTGDRRRFTRRTVKLGLQQEGFDQITEGLQAGELVVTDGAIFLSNLLVASAAS